jgi:hypothetical protein
MVARINRHVQHVIPTRCAPGPPTGRAATTPSSSELTDLERHALIEYLKTL